MKRIQEKVKDLIDVRPYKILQDFIADPAQTLAVYHFTDVTSDLMAKWLDKIVGGGVSKRRGVCSWQVTAASAKVIFWRRSARLFLTPNCVPRMSDTHVAASAQRLKRTRYRYGVCPTRNSRNPIRRNKSRDCQSIGD